MIKRIAPPLLVPLALLFALPSSWVALVAILPWVAAVMWVSALDRTGGTDAPSLGETALRRLQTL